MAKKRGPTLRSALKQGHIPQKRPVESIHVGHWRVDFSREINPRNFMKTPLVVVGGLFPDFEDFREQIAEFSASRPVYVVDLPGLGENTQANAELSHKDLAEILKTFLDHLGLEKVIPVGHMASAPIVYYFSSMYPEAVEKLILNGAAVEYRSSIRLILKDILSSLESENYEQFATRMVMGFMNYSMRDKVRHSQEIADQLHEKFSELDEKSCERYKHNIRRLLNQEKWAGGPRCPALVVVGEYDNVTTAYDGYKVVSDCLRGILAVVKSGDHLVTQQKGGQVLKAIESFVEEEELDDVRGVNVWKKNHFPIAKRRLQPRHEVEHRAVLKTSEGQSFSATLREISRQGCHLEAFAENSEIYEEQLLTLEIPEQDFEIELLMFEASPINSADQENGPTVSFRGLFKANSFHKAQETEKVIQELVEAKQDNYPVSA